MELQYDIMKAPQDASIDTWFGPKVFERTERMIDEVEKPLQAAIAYESKLVEGNIFAKMDYRRNVEIVLLISMFGTFILSALLGIFMIRRVTSRVQRVVANADRLVAKEQLLEPLPGTDEIAYVDHSFYEAANKLTQLERFKQEIIGITSHEFRTPLTSLLAKTDLMEAGVFGNLTERGMEIVSASKRRIVDLIALITNLLDVEKIQSGKNIVEKETALVDEILSKSAENVAALAKERDIQIRTPFEELSANVDSTRLIQALTAVLKNIAEHAPRQSTIILDAKSKVSKLKFRLSPLVTAARIPRYFQCRSGLAVDLLKLIAEQHGGSLEIQPTPEKIGCIDPDLICRFKIRGLPTRAATKQKCARA